MHQPGAYHHAQFMGQSLYIIKIFMLSAMFPMSCVEKSRIKCLTQFVALLYGKNFLTSFLSTADPQNDLTFWYDLKQYQEYDREIATQALANEQHHLTPELAILTM